MPRVLRETNDDLPVEAQASEAALIYAEAGIRVPRLVDLCAEGEACYLEKQVPGSAKS